MIGDTLPGGRVAAVRRTLSSVVDARVYRQDGTEDVISGDGTLLGQDVLPGFSCTLATVL